MPEYEARRDEQGTSILEIEGVETKVLVRIVDNSLVANDPDLPLSDFILDWYKDHAFYKEMHEKWANMPPPTELEKYEMQARLYNHRLHNLKVFIEKIPNVKDCIAAACFGVLVSIFGSKERAIQDWLHRSLTRYDVERARKQ